MSTRILTIGSVLVLAAASQVMARCSGYAEERIVWCDDFDSYCAEYADQWTGYPPLPPACALDAQPIPKWAAEGPYLYEADRWPLDYFPLNKEKYKTQWLVNDPLHAQNKPFCLYFARGEADPGPYIYYANRTTHNFTNAIQAKDPNQNAVNGTDEDPLILDIFIDYGQAGRAPNSVYYTELTLGTDRAPTNWVSRDCSPEVQGPFPVICQQDRAREPSINAFCPPMDDTIHSSIAIGTLAFLDPNPCDVETGRQPTRYHVVFFDGNKWSELRDGWYGTGAFDWDAETNPTSNLNHFLLTIRKNDFILEHHNSAGVVSTATIPRQYKGPFDTISSGTGLGCELNPGTGECIGPMQPFGWWLTTKPDGSGVWDGWWEVWADAPVLVDGVLTRAEGACCLPEEPGCQVVTSPGACDAAGGDWVEWGAACETNTCLGACCDGSHCADTPMKDCTGDFHGVGTECDTSPCPCPEPFADADDDGDVDQDDFGLLQVCVTGRPFAGSLPAGCFCFDRPAGNPEGDGDIDEDDVTAFEDCASGPDVSAVPAELGNPMACCLGGESCEELTACECWEQGGMPKKEPPGSTCAVVQCP